MVEENPLAASAIGFGCIAAMTYFFSYHPKLFIRVFGTNDEWRSNARYILRDPSFARGMRFVGHLQFIVAAVMGTIAMRLAIGN